MSDDDVEVRLDEWWTTLCIAYGLDDVPPVRDAILGLAGVAAHNVVRPAAPITTFLAGYAAGRAGGSAEDVAAAIATARAAVPRMSGRLALGRGARRPRATRSPRCPWRRCRCGDAAVRCREDDVLAPRAGPALRLLRDGRLGGRGAAAVAARPTGTARARAGAQWS